MRCDRQSFPRFRRFSLKPGAGGGAGRGGGPMKGVILTTHPVRDLEEAAVKRPLLWLGLSLIVALGSWTHPLPAQPPAAAPVAAESAGCATCGPRGDGPQAGQRPGLRTWLQRQGYLCQYDPDLSCSSPHQHLRFVFGSCRSFFGETCNPLPPHPVRRAAP